ncbi:MAG: hypothetical protein IPL83_20705 [Bdellovibrionales bacterium]|nr:hypothetical protein [Bdellovibrionales bacterium]
MNLIHFVKFTPFALFSLIAAAAAVAAPNLDELNQFFEPDHFNLSFKAGDQVNLISKSCLADHCDISKHQHVVDAANEEQATIVTRQGNGTEISRALLTESEWNQNSHNRVQIKIKVMESYGFQVTVHSIEPSSKTLQVNGQPRQLETRIVQLHGQNKLGMKLLVTMEVTSGLGGIAQILSLSENKGLGTDSYEIQEAFLLQR